MAKRVRKSVGIKLVVPEALRLALLVDANALDLSLTELLSARLSSFLVRFERLYLVSGEAPSFASILHGKGIDDAQAKA
jgi:hypothetical protein